VAAAWRGGGLNPREVAAALGGGPGRRRPGVATAWRGGGGLETAARGGGGLETAAA
jgi:hypothetical protein